MTNTALTWSLFGASDIAATRMIPALRARGDAVHAVVSGSADWAAEYAGTHEIPVATTDLAEALGPEVDAVYISSTNDKHLEHALAAIEAGKHVLCEKPLALTVADGEAIVAAAEAAGVVLAVNHHLPGSPLHATVRELVGNGRIGELVSARVMHAVELPERLRGWRLSVPAAEGGGVVMDITCHDASVLVPLFGTPPLRVSAIATSQGGWAGTAAPDAVMTVMEFPAPDGGRGTRLAQTHDAFTVPHDVTRLEVHGTRGSVVVRDAMTQDTPGTVHLTTAAGTEEIEVDCSTDLYTIVLDHFAAALRGEGAPTADGRAGLEAVRLALAAQRAADENRTVAVTELT